MPQSLSAVYVHGVFSTKQRTPYLGDPNIRSDCHAYIAGISKNVDCIPIIVGGVADHVHVLASLGRTVSQADWMKEMKQSSSAWMKARNPQFSWQGGYGVFSVGREQVDLVRDYIANQAEHHRTKSFQEEFLELLADHELRWDERYLWD